MAVQPELRPGRPAYDQTVRLYLASTSPARLATLRAVGIEPVAFAPGVDEEAAVAAAAAHAWGMDDAATRLADAVYALADIPTEPPTDATEAAE